MNTSKLTNLEISFAVKKALNAKGWSVRRCCEAFNIKYLEKIETSEMVPMDKDFIQRVKQNKFEVVNRRVSNLCDFLKINLDREQKPFKNTLSDEFYALEIAIQNNPKLEKTIKELLANIAEAIAPHGVH